ncbi:MAG: cytochrome b [Gammaproteobacteria bacterium]|nr:cytochrome b [Gammaproteobacteria bacterium]MBV8305860.1 cytochrome b [Gammaproteobacteria bacterium]MBV8403500.1 cytochrome b [Gammaproteobacteria bacterium]
MSTPASRAPAPDPSAELRYTRGAVALHWTMAVLIVVVGVLGLLHDSWPRSTQKFWINLHALIGLLVWVLIVVRLAWRLRHPPPALPPEIGVLPRRLSYAVHLLLYVLVFVIPLVGIVTFVWHGRAFDFGLFRVDFGVRSNRAIFHPTEDLHGYLAYTLFTLIGIHLAAALWHQFVWRDRLLQRMWPAVAERSRTSR